MGKVDISFTVCLLVFVFTVTDFSGEKGQYSKRRLHVDTTVYVFIRPYGMSSFHFYR